MRSAPTSSGNANSELTSSPSRAPTKAGHRWRPSTLKGCRRHRPRTAQRIPARPFTEVELQFVEARGPVVGRRQRLAAEDVTESRHGRTRDRQELHEGGAELLRPAAGLLEVRQRGGEAAVHHLSRRPRYPREARLPSARVEGARRGIDRVHPVFRRMWAGRGLALPPVALIPASGGLMGKFIYEGTVKVDFDDRLLAHLMVVISAKLRRGESLLVHLEGRPQHRQRAHDGLGALARLARLQVLRQPAAADQPGLGRGAHLHRQLDHGPAHRARAAGAPRGRPPRTTSRDAGRRRRRRR